MATLRGTRGFAVHGGPPAPITRGERGVWTANAAKARLAGRSLRADSDPLGGLVRAVAAGAGGLPLKWVRALCGRSTSIPTRPRVRSVDFEIARGVARARMLDEEPELAGTLPIVAVAEETAWDVLCECPVEAVELLVLGEPRCDITGDGREAPIAGLAGAEAWTRAPEPRFPEIP